MENQVNDRQRNEAEALRWLSIQLRWENRLHVLREGGTVDAAVVQEPALAA
jgi:hypothetical protein